MEQEYTTSTGYKIFYGIIAIGIIGFTTILPLTSNNGGYGHNPGLIILPIIGIIGGALIIISLFKRKIIVSDYSITRTNIWGTKEIVNNDVKGFRVGDKAIYIYPIEEGYSKLSITDYISIGDDKGLRAWLGEHFKDLDKVEFEEEKNEILHDSTLGPTEQDRERIFNNTRKYTGIYTMIGGGLLFIPLVLQIENAFIGIVLLLYPLIGMVIMAYGKGLIILIGKKSSAYASIFGGIAFPAIALVFQSTLNAKVLDFDKLWWPVVIVGVIIFATLYKLAIKRTKDMMLTQLLFAFVIAGAYGFGAVLQANCGFDQSTAQIYPVTVIDHYITHGKSTSYHITIDGWHANNSSESTSVSEAFYDNAAIGSKVNVHEKPGLLNIPWYYVTQ